MTYLVCRQHRRRLNHRSCARRSGKMGRFATIGRQVLPDTCQPWLSGQWPRTAAPPSQPRRWSSKQTKHAIHRCFVNITTFANVANVAATQLTSQHCSWCIKQSVWRHFVCYCVTFLVARVLKRSPHIRRWTVLNWQRKKKNRNTWL